MQVDIGIIGGTGIGDRLLRLGGTALHVPTPAGVLLGRYVQVNGLNLFLIGRHSAGHKVPPHKVNYRSMALGMRKLGVKACLATAAVGSLRVDWPGRWFHVRVSQTEPVVRIICEQSGDVPRELYGTLIELVRSFA